MMKIIGLSHLFQWENLHNWWLTKHFFAPLYVWINRFSSLFGAFNELLCSNLCFAGPPFGQLEAEETG